MNKKELEKWQKGIGLYAMVNIEPKKVNEILEMKSAEFLYRTAKDLQQYLIILSR